MALLRLTREITGALVGGVTDTRTPASRRLAVLGGFLASGLRFSRGMTVRGPGARPAQRLQLWDFERCPHSRIVRETLSKLDLDVEVFPCPKNGTRFRPQLEGKGTPQLFDPNTSERIIGSIRIVDHLHARYGTTTTPLFAKLKPYTILSGLAARLLTGQRGAFAVPSRAPAKPLELWSFEASPFCRFVRFKLCELELPYVLHNLGKGSPSRPAFVARSGAMRLPWLVDPNTGAQLFESYAIEQYLQQTYGC